MSKDQGKGKYGQPVRGPEHAVSRSSRPAKTSPPSELADSRKAIFSDGYPHTTSTSAKKPASAPNLAPVPRGYVHNEASFQPSTRDTTGGRISRRKV